MRGHASVRASTQAAELAAVLGKPSGVGAPYGVVKLLRANLGTPEVGAPETAVR
jgi:hypothetical protein